jgi:hypothetical protein
LAERLPKVMRWCGPNKHIEQVGPQAMVRFTSHMANCSCATR